MASGKRTLAVRWVAHDPSNEGMTFYKLNRAKNYDDYAEAIKSFELSRSEFCFCLQNRQYRHLATGKISGTVGRAGIVYYAGRR